MKRKLLWITIFSLTMAVIESAVVVYLREIYYPEGFSFPLKLISQKIFLVELIREFATILMLISVGTLTGRNFWEKFSFFLIAFGLWDILYYVFLKIFINWPSSLTEWDVLFLIPIPWIGPVIAPITIAILMIASGILIINLYNKQIEFKTNFISWLLGILGTGIILYSFMNDINATLYQKMPAPYKYYLLCIGDALYIVAFLISYIKSKKLKDNKISQVKS